MIYLRTEPFVSTIPNITHISTDWQIATDSEFTNIIESSLDDHINLYGYLSNIPVVGTPVFARVRFRLNMGLTNWSNITTCQGEINKIDRPRIVNFNCEQDIIFRPVITVDGSNSSGNNSSIQTPNLTIYESTWNRGLSITIVGDNFIDLSSNGQTHLASSWRLEDLGPQTGLAETGTEVWSSLNNTNDLTSIIIPPDIMNNNRRYKMYLSYHSLNDVSNEGTLIITTRSKKQWMEYDTLPIIAGKLSLGQLNREELIIASNTGSDFYKYNLNTKGTIVLPFPTAPWGANNGLGEILGLNDDRAVYFAYGIDNRDISIFDNSLNAWSVVTSFPNEILTAKAVKLFDGTLVFIVTENDGGTLYTKAYTLDLNQPSPSVVEVYDHGSELFFDNIIVSEATGIEEIGLINTNYNSASAENTLYLLDIITWTMRTILYPLNIANYLTAGGITTDNKYRSSYSLITDLDKSVLYAIGGTLSFNLNSVKLKDVDGFDLNTNLLVNNIEPALLINLSGHSALRLSDGRVFLAGGYTDNGNNVNTYNDKLFVLF